MTSPIRNQSYNNISCRQCGSQWQELRSCKNSITCCEPKNRFNKTITKGLVQNLKDKLTYLQNESIQFKFAKRPVKKKQQDYYCLMLRKINGLDRKLQNLEDLLLSHIDHASDEVFSARDNDKNCDYMAFYDSVRSLLDLANKLKEDVIFNKNDNPYNNKTTSHLSDQIKELESELRDLSLYLEQINLHYSDRKECGQRKPSVQECTNKCSPNNSPLYTKTTPSTTKVIFHTKPKQISLKPINQNQMYTNQDHSRHGPHLVHHIRNIENHSPFRHQYFGCDRHSKKPIDKFYQPNHKHYPNKKFNHQKSKTWSDTSFCSCNVCKMNNKRLGDNFTYISPINKLRQSNNTSFCSCSLCLHNEEECRLGNEPLNNTPRIQFMKVPQNRTQLNYMKGQNNCNHNNQRKMSNDGYNTNYFNDELDLSFYKPTQHKKRYKKKKNKGKKNVVSGNTDDYRYNYNKPTYTSPDSLPLKNVNKVQSWHRIENEELQQQNEIQSTQPTISKPHENERIIKNVIYYELLSEQKNNENTSKNGNTLINQDMQTTNQNVLKNKQAKTNKLNTQNRSQYKGINDSWNGLQMSSYSSGDLSPDVNFHKEENPIRKIKENLTKISYLSSSESNGSIYKDRGIDYMQFQRNNPVSKYQTSQNIQEQNIPIKNHLHVKFYENEEVDDHYQIKSYHGRKKVEPFGICQYPCFNRNKSKRHCHWENCFSSYNLEKNRPPKKQFNKFMIKPVYESESSESLEENKSNSGSSSSQCRIYFCSDPKCMNNSNPEELIIVLNNNDSSCIDGRKLGKIIDILKEFEMNVCDQCIVKQKKIRMTPCNMTNSKVKTKIILKKEIIKCPNCRNKLDRKIFEVTNKETKMNNNYSQDNITSTKKKVKKDIKNKVSIDKTSFSSMNENDHNTKDNFWEKNKKEKIVPTYQANIKESNLFKRLNVNDSEHNKSLEYPNFGNTININIERGPNSTEPPLEIVNSLINEGKIPGKKSAGLNIPPNFQNPLESRFAKEKEIILHDTIEAETNYDIRIKSKDTNSDNPFPQTTNDNVKALQTKDTGGKIETQIIVTSFSNTNEQVRPPDKIKSNNDLLSMKKTEMITKIKGKEVQRNPQALVVGQGFTIEDGKCNMNIGVPIPKSSKTELVNSVSLFKSEEEMPKPTSNINKVTSNFTQKNNLITASQSNSVKYKKDVFGEINSKRYNKPKEVVVLKTEISSHYQGINVPQNNNVTSRDYLYTNRVAKNLPSNRKHQLYPNQNKKIKEEVVDWEADETLSSNPSQTELNNKRPTALMQQCNMCTKRNSSSRRSDTFHAGRRASRQFKHKQIVNPRNSNKKVKLYSAIKKPVGKNSKHFHWENKKVSSSTATSKRDFQGSYYSILYSSMTSESSFSIVNWKNIAKKLKEEKNYI